MPSSLKHFSYPIVCVVAVARGGVMGRGNQLPWRLKSDLKHFKAVTLGKPMIMGRKTFESIGKALPGRETIVITRDPHFQAEGARVVASLEAALQLAERLAKTMNASEIIIAGGAVVFKEAMKWADRIVMTQIALDVEGDAVFPPVDKMLWHEASRVPHDKGEGDDAAFQVVVWERRSTEHGERDPMTKSPI